MSERPIPKRRVHRPVRGAGSHPSAPGLVDVPSLEYVFAPDGPVLGIDPGLSRCGFGVVALGDGRLEALQAGVIRTSPADPLPYRLASMAAEIEELIAAVRPAAISVERVLFQANTSTAMSVGQVSGLVLVAAQRAAVPVATYSPNAVKLAVTGDGRADKTAVQSMVTRVLRLAGVPKPADAADALALAITHCHAGLGGFTAQQLADDTVDLAGVEGVDRRDAQANSSKASRLEVAIAAALARDERN